MGDPTGGVGASAASSTRPLSEAERVRLETLHRYGLLDQPAGPELEAVVRLAAAVCGVPTATLNLMDADRQCQLTTVGFAGGDSPRQEAMCEVTLASGAAVVLADARQDQRYAANPWVTGQRARIRFYASVPLLTEDGDALGTLCVFDEQVRELSPAQVAALHDLAVVVLGLFERRRVARRAQHLAQEAEEQRELLALAYAEMEERQSFTAAVLDTVDVGIVSCDRAGRLTTFNRAARLLHGSDADASLGREELAATYHLLDLEGAPLAPDRIPLLQALVHGEVQDPEILIAPPTRSPVRVLCTGRRLVGAGGAPAGAVMVMRDVTAERAAQEQDRDDQLRLAQSEQEYRRLAGTDPLTGLANRRRWDEELARTLREAAPGEDVVVALADLDRFKLYNDQHGHQRGDDLLAAVGAVLRSTLRAGDLVARWGGEEFAVALRGCTADEARDVLSRAGRRLPDQQTMSVGLAVWERHESAAALTRRADSALYTAKHAGRDRIVTAAAVPVHDAADPADYPDAEVA